MLSICHQMLSICHQVLVEFVIVISVHNIVTIFIPLLLTITPSFLILIFPKTRPISTPIKLIFITLFSLCIFLLLKMLINIRQWGHYQWRGWVGDLVIKDWNELVLDGVVGWDRAPCQGFVRVACHAEWCCYLILTEGRSRTYLLSLSHILIIAVKFKK